MHKGRVLQTAHIIVLVLQLAIMGYLRTFRDEIKASKVFAVTEHKRTEVTANRLRHRCVATTHRGSDQPLHTFREVGHNGGHIWHVAFVVFQENAARSHNAPREPQPRGLEHRRRAMHEQIGEHPRAEIPIAAPLVIFGPIERHIRRE